jgi:hypothetical protein
MNEDKHHRWYWQRVGLVITGALILGVILAPLYA